MITIHEVTSISNSRLKFTAQVLTKFFKYRKKAIKPYAVAFVDWQVRKEFVDHAKKTGIVVETKLKKAIEPYYTYPYSSPDKLYRYIFFFESKGDYNLFRLTLEYRDHKGIHDIKQPDIEVLFFKEE